MQGIMVVIILCLTWVNYIIAVILLSVTFILILLLHRIPCCYHAGRERVRFKILWRTHSFAYSEIQSVTTEIHYSGKSRFDDTFFVIAEMTLRTDDGIHIFCSRHSFSIEDHIKEPEQFKEQMNALDLVQLCQYIKSQIESSAEIAEQTE